MGKLGQISIIVAFVIVAYLLLMVAMPVITDAASTANTTMSASSNMSNYPGTLEGTLAAPWVLWFAPAVIGMAAVIITLKRP